MDIHERVTELKRLRFLHYVAEQASFRTSTKIEVGTAGQALGLPYEEALAISDHFVEHGLARRIGRFNPPHGPAIVLTDAGIEAASHARP
jgi:hypothetical protein